MQVQSKTVVVTGAGRGIGRSIANQFAQRGANLALLDLNAADLEESRALCLTHGVEVRSYRTDVAIEQQVISAMDAIAHDFGRFDVIVNNAGIVKDSLLIKVKDGAVAERMSLSQWEAVVNVNLTGVFLCGREAAAHMAVSGQGGVIINISSISRHGNAGQTNYAATKAGVAAMTVVWAKELARYGIRAGSIAPGFTNTEILSSIRPEVLQKVIAPVPLRRLGDPAEIAHAALFIVENDFFTGRCIDLDGGLRL
jgi:3-oxoacyl-[acyl-carrier protein] reductase